MPRGNNFGLVVRICRIFELSLFIILHNFTDLISTYLSVYLSISLCIYLSNQLTATAAAAATTTALEFLY